MQKCIIIDDEPHAVEGLTKYISLVPGLTLVNTFNDPVKALLEFPKMDSVDLILLDVDMPNISGIELSKEIRHKTKKLVFTTAHTKYGYEAFEAEADAYLLKPYTLAKFASTITRLFPAAPGEDKNGVPNDFFFVKNSEDNLKIVKINYRDVIAVESKQNYVMIHTTKKKVLTYMSLTEISRILNRHHTYFQIHRSFIISKDHIETVDGNTISMVNGINITVGEFYRKIFIEFLSGKLIKASSKN